MALQRLALVLSWAIVNSVGLLWMNGYGSPLLRIIPEAIMEWLVLRSLAGMGPQWIAASVASRYFMIPLFPIVDRAFGASQGGVRFSWLALSTVLAVPIAFVLVRYSRRGWLWLAMPLVAYILGQAMYAVVGLGTVEAGRPSINIIGVQFVIGLLEGCLLAYILREQIAAPRQSPTAVASSPEQAGDAYVLIPPMVLAAGTFVLVGMMDFSAQDQGIGNFAIAQAITLGASIALLLVARTRAIGAAMAFATALIAVVPVILLGGLLILLGGGASWQGAVLPVLSLLLIGIAILAFRAVRLLPSPDRLEWPIGVSVPVGLTAILMSIV